MPTIEEVESYLGNHPWGDEIDPRKNNKKERIIYKHNAWTHIAAAAVGGAVSILLYKAVVAEKLINSGKPISRRRR